MKAFWRLTALALCTSPLLAHAQLPEEPGRRLLEEQRQKLEDRRNRPAPEIPLPAAPKAQDGEEGGPCFTITTITVEGVTLLSAQELDQVLAAFRGRCLGQKGINDLLAALTKAYVDAGYVTARAYLPTVSQQNLVHQEGGRIIADEASLQVAGTFTNTGFVTVSGALAIDAGSIVNEQRTARDTALRTFKSKGKTYGQEVVLNVLQAGGEITAGSLRLTATGDISTSGGRLASAGALDMVAGGDVTLAAARVENHESVSGGKVRWTLDTVVNHAAAIAAGLDLSVVAGGDITVAGSTLNAGGDATLRAGGDAIIAAVVDEYYYDYHSKKSRSKLEVTVNKTTNQAAELISGGGDVSVVAHDNVALQASRVAAADDVALTAETGAVALLSGTDSSFVHEKSSRQSMVWQSSRDRGDSSTSVKMTELEAGGDLTITAAKGVTADYRASGDLKASLAELAKNPATAWTAQIALRDDVTWRAVQEAHQSWDYKTQGLSGPAAAVIAIAVAVATQGAGVGALGAIGVEGLSATSAAIVNAGMSALISQASVSLINNRGDIGKVLKELGTAQTAKALAIAMVSAGLTQGVAGELKIDVSKTADFQNRLAMQGVQAASSVATNTVIGGVKFTDALRSQLLSSMVNAAAAEGFRGVGDYAKENGIANGSIEKAVAHAVIGGVAAEASGGSFAAGAAAGAATELASTVTDGMTSQRWRETSAVVAGGIAAALTGADGKQTSNAANLALLEQQNNHELHRDEAEALQKIKDGKSDEEKRRLEAAACYLKMCAEGIPTDDPLYAPFAQLQATGAAFVAEQQQLRQTGLFEYTKGEQFADWISTHDQGLQRGVGAGQAAVGSIGAVASASGGAALCAGSAGTACAVGATLASLGIVGGYRETVEGFDNLLRDYEYRQGIGVWNSFSPDGVGVQDQLVANRLISMGGVAAEAAMLAYPGLKSAITKALEARAAAKVAANTEKTVADVVTSEGTANAAAGSSLKLDLQTTQAANDLVESLRLTGKLPSNYLTKNQAMQNGWQPGKALNSTTPGGQIGGDVFHNSNNIVPSMGGRIWYEADVGLASTMSRSNQPGTRLLYSSDGLLYITVDHYNTAIKIGTWK